MIETFLNIPASIAAARTQQNADNMVKIREDLARYELVIAGTRPDMIVECGTWEGYSARWFRDHVSRVISVDIRCDVVDEVRQANPAVFLNGSSTDPGIGHLVTAMARGSRVMVVLDSDHHAEHVADEIRLYGPLVSPGCYLVVEDGIAEWLDEEDYDGPLHAIEKELAGNPGWRRAVEIEKLSPITMHPAGWWQKL